MKKEMKCPALASLVRYFRFPKQGLLGEEEPYVCFNFDLETAGSSWVGKCWVLAPVLSSELTEVVSGPKPHLALLSLVSIKIVIVNCFNEHV